MAFDASELHITTKSGTESVYRGILKIRMLVPEHFNIKMLGGLERTRKWYRKEWTSELINKTRLFFPQALLKKICNCPIMQADHVR